MSTKLFNRKNETEMLEKQIEKVEGSPLWIGNLAVEFGFCTAAHIEEALKVQRERLRLGQILVDLGFLTEDQLADLVIEQRIRLGEKVSAEDLHRHERSKFRCRVRGITAGFRRAGDDAKYTAQSINACMATVKS